MALKGIQAGDILIRVVTAYRHLGTMVTPTACPTQDAARRVSLATSAYAIISGHVLSSKQFCVKIKLQTTAALVDATLLHSCELWASLAEGPASRIEAVYKRWLRKATAQI